MASPLLSSRAASSRLLHAVTTRETTLAPRTPGAAMRAPITSACCRSASQPPASAPHCWHAVQNRPPAS